MTRSSVYKGQPGQDHPIPIDNILEDRNKFSIIRDNIEILWRKTTFLIDKVKAIELILSSLGSTTTEQAQQKNIRYEILTDDYNVKQSDDFLEIVASSNDVELKFPANPRKSELHEVICSDVTYVAEVNFNGKKFYGSTSNHIFTDVTESYRFIYNGVEWR